MADKYLIWWTSQDDCERIAPLDTWPTWLYGEFCSRHGRPGRGRLWVPTRFNEDAEMPEEATWRSDNWLCAAAETAGGIVIPSKEVHHVQFLPGFVTTFEMSIPDLDRSNEPAVTSHS
jgi:hypothetical protein